MNKSRLKRDPRIDPKPGDILRIGTVYGGQFYEVLFQDLKLGNSDVSYMREGVEHALSLNSWKSIMEKSEVIRAVRWH